MRDLTKTKEPVGMYQGASQVDLLKVLMYFQQHRFGYLVTNVTVELPTGDLIQPHIAFYNHIGEGRYSKTDPDGRVQGAPHLAIDVERRIEPDVIDLRKAVYAAGGVEEFMLWDGSRKKITWYRIDDGIYREVPPDDDGVVKSSAVPGLWMCMPAVLCGENMGEAQWRSAIDKGLRAHPWNRGK